MMIDHMFSLDVRAVCGRRGHARVDCFRQGLLHLQAFGGLVAGRRRKVIKTRLPVRPVDASGKEIPAILTTSNCPFFGKQVQTTGHMFPRNMKVTMPHKATQSLTVFVGEFDIYDWSSHSQEAVQQI